MTKFLNKLWDFIVFIMDFVIRRLLHIPLSEKQWDALIQFVKFGIVGVSNTLIHYFTYLILIALGCHYLIASVAGFLVSVVNAFYWNNKYVFTKEEGAARVWWQAFFKTI